jgi:nucleoside-diphosphate kinase
MKKIISNLVVVLIKPDLMDFLIEALNDIAQAGFCLLQAKTIHLNAKQLRSLYKKHKDAEWFPTMLSFMEGKEMRIAIFQKKNAVSEFQKIKGHKDPRQAAFGTLRKVYGVTVFQNGIDSSSSAEETSEKIKFFFPEFVIEE